MCPLLGHPASSFSPRSRTALARLIAGVDTLWHEVVKALPELEALAKGGPVAAGLGASEGA